MKNNNITVVMTGGTIGSTIKDGTINVSDEPVILREYRRLYGDDTKFRIIAPFNILSENCCPKTWCRLGRVIADINDDSDGIIITHGTDTLAYTAAYIAMVFKGTKRPIVIVSSDLPPGEKGSNGIYNFKAAVDFIENENITGVFAAYRDMGGRDRVYLASRIVEADTYTDSFSAYGGCPYGEMENGHFIRYANAVNPKAFMLKGGEALDITELTNSVLMIRSYPGIDYGAFDLKTKPSAILHCMYHSGTAWEYGLTEFIKRCKAEGIDVYLCCYKSEEGAKYATARAIIASGGIPLYRISAEAAYVKLVLAYNQHKCSPIEFMKNDVYFETVNA